MAPPRSRRRIRQVDYWPGFVDALSTMLLVIIFLLSVFMLAQFFLAREVTGKDTVLEKLNRQIEQLSALLALERAGKTESDEKATLLASNLDAAQKDKARLQGAIDAKAAGDGGAAAQQQLAAEKDASAAALAQIDILNQQIAALRRQLAAIEDALSASEKSGAESQAKIADLGSRLNIALAQKVQELARYRSDFFGRLRQILGDRPGVSVVGDRFIFQSEVLFESSQAVLDTAGRAELDKLASALIELEHEIPPDIPWIIRVDGHTDKKPIQSSQYPSNWSLSAARAIAVVQYLVSKGVSPQRLAAAGFGEFQPLDPGEGDDANRRNRRIELKITEK
ncbi:OmpA/MotB domain protein [Methylocella silvestris BL2]|uniref:OmpA/MotB domain protein n=1 Tax=Methylocella silvestris (strain DSM 15510 / CIP 108128 / LMG 27833 / NCIMB 13906 / BL2) TaxID=395965 RepID=B8ERP6_METSB|nr:peptidoglycan -binding protein [Methylocella silvestris]ACK51098.1 OmpA/MotB domain protein [Methylocella silvestris BL2]